jgi:hypothetical protein
MIHARSKRKLVRRGEVAYRNREQLYARCVSEITDYSKIKGSFGGNLRETGLPIAVKLRVFVVVDQETTGLPVRSAVLKLESGGLVVRWVTTGESPLLYVLLFALKLFRFRFLRMEMKQLGTKDT